MGAERNIDKQPSEEEVEMAASVLKRLPQGILPYPLFKEITRLTTTCIYELVPLRVKNEVVDILNVTTTPDDEFWPNQWHAPGTVVRPTDKTESNFSDAKNRVIHGELEGIKTIGEPAFFGLQHRQSSRSSEMVAWHYILVDEDNPKVGEYF